MASKSVVKPEEDRGDIDQPLHTIQEAELEEEEVLEASWKEWT